MGRKKQKPNRSVSKLLKANSVISDQNTATPGANIGKEDEGCVQNVPLFVDVDSRVSGEHKDISEVLLTNLNFSPGFTGFDFTEGFDLRFRVCNASDYLSRFKCVHRHWPALSSDDIYLEFILKREVEKNEPFDVVVCGNFDGNDEGVSGLVHLASLKFLSLRLVPGAGLLEGVSSLRLRVEILEGTFDACESLLEVIWQPWKKSMMSVMAWLRPEVTTSEARYGVHLLNGMEVGSNGMVENGEPGLSRFDTGRFYEAIKRSKECPMLDVELPDLLPELRPYQRRAAHWMVERERGALNASKQTLSFSPLCVAVDFLDSCSKMFYNPLSGTVSLSPELPYSYIPGGILADEMGLGKTVELLACVFANRKSESCSSPESMSGISMLEEIRPKRVKRERVECVCGALTESYRYKGLWVQCDICDAWQHADCVNFMPSKSRKRSQESSNGSREENNRRKKKDDDIVVIKDLYICQLCLELRQATSSPIDSAATLIVCPAPILRQWHAEILRHTNPGSMRVCIYEGVRDISLSNSSTVDINQVANADIVLTTYEVLREDLSHDSERHQGDRRLMRYRKRYPVIPTVLTRISWWRVCLDEAQMVESNAAAATEMAMRLNARHRWCITGTPIQRELGDLFGLLRFLKASPYDVSRWWIDAIRDPYERRDVVAMEFTHKLFSQLMWRSSKSHVADELQLPPQEERVSRLSFSSIEEHFYQRQHETCLKFAREILERFKTDISKRESSGSSSSDSLLDPPISHLEASKLLTSLLKLRQACCHPQVGGSGLRSIQRSPMTMDEILSVLIGKTKMEGEEALRKVVSSLNGLAGIALIRGELSEAASLYKEALALSEQNSEDFRLDPLLNLHIHYNLAEVLKSASSNLQTSDISECGAHIAKKQKVSRENSPYVSGSIDLPFEQKCDSEVDGFKDIQEDKTEFCAPETSSADSLANVCESIKQKYVFVFYSRFLQAQQEFQKSYIQVCEAVKDKERNYTTWWLEALQQIEQKKEAASELLRRIETTFLGNQDSSNIVSRFQHVNGLRYYIQTGLDSLYASRKILLDQLIEIDGTMEKPRDDDVERVRYCPNCYGNVGVLLCVHCDLDKLFQAYEARLFLKRGDNGGVIASAEELVDEQKKRLERNQFFWNMDKTRKNSASSSVDIQEAKRERDAAKMLVVSRSPSELEIILGVVRSYLKKQLGTEGLSAANKHMLLLEGMRKEYVHARSLAIAQAQILRAYDEIKMATSRLRLRESESDNSIDTVSLEELDICSVENSSEKFVSLETLSRITGKLRYLQGLMLSKQKTETDRGIDVSVGKVGEEICPVCQENLRNQRSVFQCGHVTCCKCLFAMTERSTVSNKKVQEKWVICPTCRQRSDFDSIALADDGQGKPMGTSCDDFEVSISVQGSYGTKIAAITRRIMWIKSTDPKAKVLVFSTWNDVLDVLEHAFAANEISFVRMKGRRKRSQGSISVFKEDKTKEQQREPKAKSVQVLLLLIKHGANGLNLLEAQHVILVEPLLNPAAEAQAISRVHRIGQTTKTLIHRFLVKDTVEESIYRLNKTRDSSSVVSGNTKNLDEPILTFKDVESLFAINRATESASISSNIEGRETGTLTHLPPSAAAATAAERRLNECRT